MGCTVRVLVSRLPYRYGQSQRGLRQQREMSEQYKSSSLRVYDEGGKQSPKGSRFVGLSPRVSRIEYAEILIGSLKVGSIDVS